MTEEAKRHMANGEDNKSIVILLEAHFPQLQHKVGEGWIERLRK